MDSNGTPDVLASGEMSSVAADVPIEELVAQAYEAAQPAIRNRMLARLVGKVYETAPLTIRSRLLEHLLQPLGVLALVAVADGVFAKIRFRSGWPDMHVRLEDAQNVQASDVIVLVDHVQQVSMDVVNGLMQLLATSPAMASSAAVAVLVSVLVQNTRTRRASDSEGGSPAI
ncbi:MAG: hypothetical protein ABI606_07900 [Rhodoferax sp.]